MKRDYGGGMNNAMNAEKYGMSDRETTLRNQSNMTVQVGINPGPVRGERGLPGVIFHITVLCELWDVRVN